MSDSSAPAMSAGRRRTTAVLALIAVGAVIVLSATTGPSRLRAGAEALPAASPEPSGAAGTGMAELDAAIAATQRALGDVAVEQTVRVWAARASQPRSGDTAAVLRHRDPVMSDTVVRTADGDWSWVTHQNAWDGPDAAGEEMRSVDDETYWSSRRLPVSEGDPGWWHVVDHRIDYVELYPEALLDNAAAHTAWRPSATDGATRYEAVDLDTRNDGLAFTVGQDHGLLVPFAEGEPRDEALVATLTLVVDNATGLITRVEAERRGVDQHSGDAPRDVIEHAEMMFHADGVGAIPAPTDARDISADEWGGCAYGGECDQDG